MSLVDTSPRLIGQLPPVGPIAFGMWRFTNTDLDDRRRLVAAALDAGLNLFDTADVYGLDWGGTGFGTVEELLGEVLRHDPSMRDRMVLATKGGILPPTPYDSSAKALRKACEDSLRRLGVETIDLYQIHRPDMFSHPAEVAETLASLRSEGKIREVGVSNHTVAQYEALAAHLPFPLAANQFQYSVTRLDPLRDGTFDHCMQNEIRPLVWSPLDGGRIASGSDLPEGVLALLDRLARREGVDRTAIALAFVLAHPARPVAIVGSQSPERVATVLETVAVGLERADVYALVQEVEGKPLP